MDAGPVVQTERGAPSRAPAFGPVRPTRPIRRIAEYQGDFPRPFETCMKILRVETKKPLGEVEAKEVVCLMEHLANKVRLPSEATRQQLRNMWRELRGVIREAETETGEIGRLRGEVMSLGPAFPERAYLKRRVEELTAERQEVAEELELRKKQYEEAQRVVERGENLVAETTRMIEKYSSIAACSEPNALAFAVECRTIGASLRSLTAMAEREQRKQAAAERKWAVF